MRPTAHHSADTAIDIAALINDARELNRQAVQIASSPPGGCAGIPRRWRQELRSVLDELEETLRALRAMVAEAPSPSIRTAVSAADRLAALPVGVAGRLILDTTEAMIHRGQLVPPAEFQQLMGWATRQAVWKAVESHRVFYLAHKAERYFPTFYSDTAHDRRRLGVITKLLGDLAGGSKLQFFLTRRGSLGGETPLQALAAGRFAKVRDVAAAFAEAPQGVCRHHAEVGADELT